VDKKIGRVNTSHGRLHGGFIKDIALHDFCLRLHPVSDELRLSRHAADAVSLALQFTKKPPAHIAGRSGYEDASVIKIIHSRYMPGKAVSDNRPAQRNKKVPGIYSGVFFFFSYLLRSIYDLPDYICGHVLIEHEC
jgi:hypothetical protein